MSELPYEEGTDDAFGDTAARTFVATTIRPGTVELSGPCPRCGTVIRVPLVTGTYKSFRIPRRGTAAPPRAEERTEPVICTCEDEHPGRPEGGFGCGAFWNMILALD